jgi:uncharacterized protein
MFFEHLKAWYSYNSPDIGDHVVFFLVITAVFVLYYGEARLLLRYLWARLKKRDFIWPTGWWRCFLHVVASIGLLLLAYAHFIEPYWIDINSVTLRSSKLHGISLRIVQISDLHSDAVVLNEDRLAGIINPLKPDIIVFAGDSLNSLEGLGNFKRGLSSLKASVGKFAVKGNVDQWHWRRIDLFGGTGFEELGSRNELLQKNGESFYISGLDFGQSYKTAGLLRNRRPELFAMFLYHTPALAEKVRGVDLYLCGHTHGGQVRLPFYGAIITFSKFGKKYEAGRYDINGMTLYVNRGLGLDGGLFPRVRFLCRPEITVIDVKPERDSGYEI